MLCIDGRTPPRDDGEAYFARTQVSAPIKFVTHQMEEVAVTVWKTQPSSALLHAIVTKVVSVSSLTHNLDWYIHVGAYRDSRI